MKVWTIVLAGALCTLIAPPVTTASDPHAARDVGALLSDLNAASDGTVTVVAMQCLDFIPDLVTVANGATVTWVWLPGCNDAPHTVTSSGSALNAASDKNKPMPHPLFKDMCFDSLDDVGVVGPANPVYSVAFTFAGIVVRDVGGPLMRVCAGASSIDVSALPPSAVIPYYCSLHGTIQPAGSGMRGAVIVTL